MIDIHSHILPGIDDGSKSLEMTETMLEMLRQQGVEAVVATPHFNARRDTPESFLQRRAEAAAKLQLNPNLPRVILGAEVSYIDNMSSWEAFPSLRLGDTDLLMVEMPFYAWTHRMVREICQMQDQTGLRPVLAHVERYRRRDQLPRYQKQLLEAGVLFQCNADSFLTFSTRHWLLGQLKKGNIHFLGSDTHNITDRQPRLDLAAEIITKKLGSGVLEKLTAYSKEMLKL
jgi:protein-tyrosine phosphatase